ncbi:MAG: hypothetical protein ACLFTK_00790 [Anaerolineales bacterium]
MTIQTELPSNFQPAESALEGIQVFKPVRQEADHTEIVTFDCPNCGADRAFSVAEGGLTCTFCGYHEEPESERVGKAAEEFSFNAETIQQASHGWGIARKEIQCENCGAQTTLPEDMLTHTCSFCGSEKVIQRKAAQDLLRPRVLIVPVVETDQCRQVTRQWLGSSWMTPNSLKAEAVLDRFDLIYLPFWTFDADTDTQWRAEVGERRTSGTGDNRRTYTVWEWRNGQLQRSFDDFIVSGTTKVSEVLLDRVSDFDTEGLVTYNPGYLAGVRAQAYDRDLETSWQIGREKMREIVKEACRAQALRGKDKIRNFSMKMDWENERWRYCLMPVYISAYQFEDETYQVVVNAQTANVNGQRPVAWLKVIAAVVAVMVPSVMCMLVGGLVTLLAGDDSPFQVVGYVAFMMLSGAFAWSANTIQKALSFDDI